MAKALRSSGYSIGRYQASTMMRRFGLQVRIAKRFKVTTNRRHKLPVAANLLNREFLVCVPDRVYVVDISYLCIHEVWVYLAAVIDLFSRKVVGWSMSSRITIELPLKALRMAYWSRKPGKGIMYHSDRGSQYASLEYQNQLKAYEMVCSMSRKYNSVMERFFGSLKRERTDHYIYNTRAEVESHVVDYILFYNNDRLHLYLDYMSPVDFEK